eukprot:EG_transcript_14056
MAVAYDFEEQIPEYVIDLDAPPRERWKRLVEDHKEELLAFLRVAADEQVELFGVFGHAVARLVGAASCRLGQWLWPAELWEEMAGIAEVTAQWDPTLDHSRWVMLNIAYDYYARCTCAVLSDARAAPVHLRVMDWHVAELRDLTVNVRFRQGRKELFRVTTWVGFVGVLTGMRKGAYSVAVNYRFTAGSLLRNLATALSRSWPLSFLVRDVLHRIETYPDAVKRLSTARLIAPCYIVVCGCRAGEGVVLTRNRLSQEPPQALAQQPLQACRRRRALRWVVQANLDPGAGDVVSEDVLVQNSMVRVANLVEYLKTLQWDWRKDPALARSAFLAMRAPEVTSLETIYHTVMRPQTGLYRSVVVHCEAASNSDEDDEEEVKEAEEEKTTKHGNSEKEGEGEETEGGLGDEPMEPHGPAPGASPPGP